MTTASAGCSSKRLAQRRMSLTPGTSTRLHSITLPQVEALDRNESPAPRPRASQPALARARPPPLGNSHPIPFLRALPRTRIRTGSLATPCGSREILALIGTRALTRNSATYTEICTLPRSTPRHRARFCARQPPSYPSLLYFAAEGGDASGRGDSSLPF